MFHKPFQSSKVIILDNTLKSTWLVLVLIMTNIAVIINKMKSLNFNLDSNLIIFIVILLFVCINFIRNIIQWNITYVAYQNKVITVYKNIVDQNKYEFSIKNISSVIIEESFFDKVFHVCRMRIYTYGAYNFANDMEFVIHKEKCLALRDQILQDLGRKLDHPLEDKKCDIKIGLKNIILHSFFQIPISQITILVNVLLIIVTTIHDSSGIQDIFYNLLGIFITVFGIMLPVLYHFLKSIFTFYGLRLDRNGEFLQIKHGFVATKRYLIPIDKIQAIVLNETFLSRIFQYVSVSFISSGISDNKNEIKLLFPMMKQRKVNQLIQKILYDQDYNISSQYSYQPLKSVYFFALTIMVINTFLLPIMVYYGVSSIWSITCILLSFMIIYFLYYFKRIQIYDTYLSVITGVFLKKKVILKYENVKYFKVKKDPILGKYGISRIDVYITSGIKNRKHSLGYVSYKNAQKVLERIYQFYISDKLLKS